MPSSVMPHTPVAATGNGVTPPKVADAVSDSVPIGRQQNPQPNQVPRNPLLAKLTSLTSIAAVAAAGMIVVGALALVGGHYDKQVVHDQLAPQKIFFPKPATNPGLAAYAGQQVLTGKQAKLYAEKQIGVDLTKVADGKTYSQLSAEWIAGGMKNTTLAGERTTLFMGETLNGLLLNAWGWSVISGIATLAGFILILLGGALFLLPLANWQVNLRGRHPAAAGA
jgi:hypothetical protein